MGRRGGRAAAWTAAICAAAAVVVIGFRLQWWQAVARNAGVSWTWVERISWIFGIVGVVAALWHMTRSGNAVVHSSAVSRGPALETGSMPPRPVSGEQSRPALTPPDTSVTVVGGPTSSALDGPTTSAGESQASPAREPGDERYGNTVASIGLAGAGLLLLFGLVSCLPVTDHPGQPAPARIGNCPLPPGEVALVVGGRANSASPRVTDEIGRALRQAFDNAERTTIVGVDGDPAIAFQTTPDPGAAANTTNRRFRQEDFVKGLTTAVTRVRSQEPQADVLGAVRVAADVVGRESTVIIMDSGLQTVEPLNLGHPQTFEQPPGTLVGRLQQQGLVMDLTGRTIIFAGLGDVAAPQPPLGSTKREHLRQLWQTYADQAGASCTAFVSQPVNGRTGGDIAAPPSVDIVR